MSPMPPAPRRYVAAILDTSRADVDDATEAIVAVVREFARVHAAIPARVTVEPDRVIAVDESFTTADGPLNRIAAELDAHPIAGGPAERMRAILAEAGIA